jgi:opacity protein-like surface antigen
MKKYSSIFIIILILAVLGFFWSEIAAATLRVEIKGAYFKPSDEAFRDIYGQGQTFGAELGFKFNRFIGLWLSVDSFSKKGQMTFTQEETTLKIMPISAGLSLEVALNFISPYAHLGLGYFHYEESNILGQVKKNNLGFVGQIGLLIKTVGPLYLDLFGQYSSCKVKPLELEANLGGLIAGLGLGLQF